MSEEVKKFIEVTKDWDFSYIKKTINNDDEALNNWINNLELSDKNLKSFLKTWNGIGDISSSYQNWMVENNEKTSIFSSVASKAGNVMKSLGSSLKSMGIEAVAGAIFDAAIDLFTSLEEKEEQAAQKAKAMSTSLNNFYSSFSEGSTKIDDLSSKYQQLSKGVSDMGANISLTDKQYTEYKNTVQELSELMPNLSTIFNEQGEKIGFAGGKIKDVTKQYQASIQSQAQSFLRNGDNDGNTFQDTLDDFNYSSETNTYGWSNAWRDTVGGLLKSSSLGLRWLPKFKTNDYGSELFGATQEFSEQEQLDILDQLVNAGKDSWSVILGDSSTGDSKQTNLVEELLGIDVDKVSDMTEEEYDHIQEILAQRITGIEQLLAAKARQVTSGMNSILLADDDYWSIDENIRNAVSSMISGLNTDALTNLDIDLNDQLSVETWMAEVVDDIKSNKNNVTDAIQNLFNLDTEELNPSEAKELVHNYITTIAKELYHGSATLEQIDALKESFNLDNVDHNYDKFQKTLKENFNEKKTKYVQYIDSDGVHYGEQEVYDSGRSYDLTKWSETNKVTQKELEELTTQGYNAKTSIEELNSALDELRENKKKEMYSQTFSSFWNTLGKTGTEEEQKQNEEEKKKLLQLAEKGKLTTEQFEKSSIASQIQQDTGLSADSVTMKINQRAEDTRQLNSMKTGVSAITSAYDEKKNSKNKSVSVSTLDSMYDTLGVSEWNAADQQVWEDYKKTAGDGSKSLSELKDTQDELAQSYLNSNNFLTNLKKSNKDYYQTVLEEIGIMNAESLVAEQLAINLQQAKEAKLEKALAPIDISHPTEEDIQGFKEEAAQLGISNDELADFLIKKQQVSETGLNDMQSITTLIEFCHHLGLTNDELEKLIRLKKSVASPATKDSQGNSLETTTGSQWGQKPQTSPSMNGTTTEDMIQGALATQENSKKNAKSNTAPKTSQNNKSDDKASSKTNTTKASAPKTKQEIDWISRKLTVLQSKIDQTKARFENLFSLKSKKSSLNTQISQTTKLLKAQEKASTKYQKKANGTKLSKALKTKVKNGDITGNLSSLIHKYDDKTANKITTYQNYIDKVKEAKKAIEELRSSLKELNKQKLDLSLDNNETKRSYFEAKYSNATTVTSKNKILDKEISTYRSDDQSYNTFYKKAKKLRKSSGKTALSALNKSGLGSSIKKKIKNLIKKGKEIPKDLLKKVKKNNPSLYNKLIDYNNNVDYVSDALRAKDTSKEETKTAIREKQMEKIDNIQKEYENKIGQLNNNEQDIQNQLSLMEARGQTVTADYYQRQNDYEVQKRAEAVNEKSSVEHALKEAMAKGDIKIYSDEWYEIQSSLQTLDNTINDCDIAIANNSAAIRELHTTMLDNMAENAARLNTEADFIATLLSHEELTDSKTGKLTDSGLGTLGTYGMRLDTSKSQVENFNHERDILEDMRKKGILRLGDGSHDYDSLEQFEEAYNKIIDRQQEWVKNEFDAEQQIIDLMKSKYQAQLDYMKDIIDAKKKILSMEKDLYDYQRNIADKTKNIATLQKQLSALQGDDSEEGRARRSKLQTSLDEANLDLQDTEYDRYISDQQNMLDNMSSQYEDLLSCLFKDTDALLQEGIDLIRDTGPVIQGVLDNTAEKYSYNYSESFEKIIECLAKDGSPSANPPTGNAGTGQNPKDQTSTSTGSQPADSAVFSSMQDQINNAEQSIRNAEITQLASFLRSHSGKSDTTKPLRPAKKGESFSSELNQKLSKYGYVVKSGTGSGGLKYIDMFAQILGNQSGDGSFKANGKVYKALSQKYPHIGFQTGGIIRADGVPKDGDNIHVRVNPNETVLTQDFTKLLPEAVDIMQRFTRPVSIPEYLQNMRSLPLHTPASIGSINLSLDLPDVQNAQDFITELQSNRKIQRALEISISDCIKSGRITNNIQSIL